MLPSSHNSYLENEAEVHGGVNLTNLANEDEVHHLPTQVQFNNRNANDTNVAQTPIQLTRRNLRHVSSSSLRRRQHKPVHCKYCVRYRSTREDLEHHLKESGMRNAMCP